jgi:nucleosome binding factor SPN SPT16 subunit
MEQPYLVVNFDEVEVVNFERVTFMTKMFDCVFIFKNKAKPVTTISSIETAKLPFIKELLDSHNIVFLETKVSINWNNLMSTIMKDPLAFYESGGWCELLREDDVDESEEASSNISTETDDTVDSETESDVEDESSEDEEESSEIKKKKKK